MEALNIKLGKFSWEIIVELTLISNDGNLLDAMNLSALAILMKGKRTKVMVEDNIVKKNLNSVVKEESISFNHVPFSFTFGILKSGDNFDDNEIIVLDPNVNL